MLRMSLDGSWQMKRLGHTEWLPAQVPGSVYNDLFNAGQMPDPFYRENEEEVLELANYDYEYWRSFEPEAALLEMDQLFLR